MMLDAAVDSQAVHEESAMPVEWQGDHKILGDEKKDFERELRQLGLQPSEFLVQIRRELPSEGSSDLHAVRYEVYINDLKHPDRETWKLEGGRGRNWITEFAQVVKSRRG
jgi:hypothetical protein